MATSSLTVATPTATGLYPPPLPGNALRRDHRIVLRVIESRFSAQAAPSSDIDLFAIVRITYSGAPSFSGPSSPLSPNGADSSHAHGPSGRGPDLAPPAPISGFRKMSLIVGRPPAHSTSDLAGGGPSGMVSLGRRSSTTVQVGKTPTLYRVRDSAFFDHSFEVDLVSDVRYIEVELYQKRMLKDSLLGSVVIPGDALSTHKPLEKWFPVKSHSSASLLSSPTVDSNPTTPLASPSNTHTSPAALDLALKPTSASKTSANDADNTGITLRIRLSYWNEHLLPLTVYKPLVAVLMDPKMAVISCLERSVEEDRDDVARTLVSVMFSMDMHEPLLIGMATREVQATTSPTLLFRANSVASKALDHFMKLVGKQMLDNVLRPVIKTIITDNRVCELDRSRLSPASASSSSTSQSTAATSAPSSGTPPPPASESSPSGSKPNSVDQQLQDNLSALEGYIQWTVERIMASADECPRTLRNVFTAMRSAASIKWPMDPVVPYTVVSSFLFLRLFNAAILGPKLFGLCDTFPNANVSRTLTLVSKSLQQLANQSLFDGAKEPYMTPLNPFLETLFPRVRRFLELMSTPVSRALPTTRKASISMHGSIPGGHGASVHSHGANTLAGSPISETGHASHRTSDRSSTLGVPNASSADSPSSAKSPGGSSGSRKNLVKKLFGGGSGSSSNNTGSSDGLDHGGSSGSSSKSGKGLPSSKSSMLGGSTGSISAANDLVKSMDIEREFADLFRILTRIIDVMQKQANDAELPSVNRLAIILRELTAIKERRMSSAPSAALIDAISRARELAAAEGSGGDGGLGSRRSSNDSSANASRRGSLALANSEPFVADWVVSSPPAIETPGGSVTLPHAAAGPPGGPSLRALGHSTGSGLSDSAPQLGTASDMAANSAPPLPPPTGTTPPAVRSRVFGFHRPSSGTSSSRSRSSTMSNGRSGLFRGFSLTVEHEATPSGDSSTDPSAKSPAGSQGNAIGANNESPLRSSAPMLVVSGSADDGEVSRLVDDTAAMHIR